jgi:hypothetical protein
MFGLPGKSRRITVPRGFVNPDGPPFEAGDATAVPTDRFFLLPNYSVQEDWT